MKSGVIKGWKLLITSTQITVINYIVYLTFFNVCFYSYSSIHPTMLSTQLLLKSYLSTEYNLNYYTNLSPVFL